MSGTDTICATCRTQLEAHVFSVRAEDYPVPARPVRKSERGLDHEMVPTAATVEAQLSSAVDEAADLVPLAPTQALLGADSAGPKSAATIAIQRPAPPPTPVEMDTPVEALKSTHTSRNVMIVLIAVVITGILAAGIWSLVVPGANTASAEPTHVVK